MSVIDNNKYAQYRLILKNFPNCLSPSRFLIYFFNKNYAKTLFLMKRRGKIFTFYFKEIVIDIKK